MIMSEIGPRIVLAVAGAALAAGGLVIAANVRGCATWYARRTEESLRRLGRVLRHIPPWKRLLGQSCEQRVAEQAGLARVLGVVVACTGLLLLVAAFIATDVTTS
jgi:hypothetical protein